MSRISRPPSPADPTGDIQIFGSSTRQSAIRADARDGRRWLDGSPVCPLLKQHHIGHAGIMRAAPPYEVVRSEQSGTYMLACFEGEGVVLADGVWKRISRGQACLLPPFVLNALKCLPGKTWKFAWVRYDESRETTPILSSLSPVSGDFDPLPLKFAIEGLHAEVQAAGSSPALHHWTELIHHYVVRFAQPTQPDDRLWRLWQVVEKDVRHPWSLTEMAGIACMSEEHLRRLCRKQLGRSPMQQVTFLRLQKARRLLAVTGEKVETIAREVGFANTFSFSNTFKKWIGARPSEFRRGT